MTRGLCPWSNRDVPEHVVHWNEVEPFRADEIAAEGVEPRGLARRLRRSNRQHRANPVGAPVEPLEEDRPGGDGGRGCQP